MNPMARKVFRSAVASLASVLAVLLVTAPAFPAGAEKGDPGEPAGKTDGKKAEKKDSILEKAVIVPVKISGSGYLEGWLKVDEKQETAAGVTVKASIVPDAYRFLMARGMEELEKTNIVGPQLLSRLRELHSKCKSKKNKMLLRISVSASDPKAYCILTLEPRKHLRLAHKPELPFSLDLEGAKLVYEQWKVFEYPPGTVRGFSRPRLCAFQSTSFGLSCPVLKETDKDPIHLSLLGIAVQMRSADPKSSINPEERQLSLRKWEDITVKEVKLTFYPGRWKIPEPPRGFEEALARLDKY